MTGTRAPSQAALAPDAGREGWCLDILHVAGDGAARHVHLGPWPAHGDPERAALALGRERGWPGGLYALRLVVAGEVRAWREAALHLPSPPATPLDPWAGVDRALSLALDLARVAARRPR